MRLQKYIANAGVASRRKSEELIVQGRVEVNGKIVRELGTKVEPGDRVKVDGRNVKPIKRHSYFIVHKPMGVVSTASDEKGRMAVTDLVEEEGRVYPVGRLDIDATGLIFLTDDGAVAQKIMHPSKKIKKTYIVTVEGTPDRRGLEKLRRGVYLGKEKTAPGEVKILKRFERDSILELIIHEGKNHQVKRMCEAIGHPVKKLKRIAIGELTLGSLEPGNYRPLNEEERKWLKTL